MAKKIDKSKLPDLLLAASQDWMLSAVDVRVYAYLCAQTIKQDDVYIEKSTTDLAKTINHSKGTLSKALSHLETQEYIETHHHSGQCGKYSVIGLAGVLREDSQKRKANMEDFLNIETN